MCTHLWIMISAACSTGYTNRPSGISFTVADFSLYCGRWPNRAIVVRQLKIQPSSACWATVDCRNSVDFCGSMPQASRVAVIWRMLCRSSAGS